MLVILNFYLLVRLSDEHSLKLTGADQSGSVRRESDTGTEFRGTNRRVRARARAKRLRQVSLVRLLLLQLQPNRTV